MTLRHGTTLIGSAAIVLLAIVAALDLASIRHRSRTYDEKSHLGYGIAVLHGAPNRRVLDAANSKMPITALNAVPRIAAEIVDWPEGIEARLNALGTARVVTIAFAVLLAFYVYHWSRALHGDVGGLLSLFLFAFSPNLIGHAGLVTTDLYAACFTTIASYHFWRFNRSSRWLDGVASAVTLGIAQLVKYSCLLLYATFAVIAIVRAAPRLRTWWRTPPESRERLPLRRVAAWLSVYVLVSLAVVNLGFLCDRSMTRLEDYEFRSRLLQRVQSHAGVLGALPVPLPYPFLDGLDWVIRTERGGMGMSNVYLGGQISWDGQGFAGYYLWAFLFKEPLPAQALIVCAFLAYWRRRRDRRFLDDDLFVLAPLVCFGFYFFFVFRGQIGFRFILVLLPLLYVFCGSLARNWPLVEAWPRRTLYALLAYQVVSVLSYFPHYISYFNELVWDRKLAYKVLADSNLDWGQSRYDLDRYLAEHPQAIFEPAGPTSGEIVIGINKLVGVFRRIRHVAGVEKYRWLRDHFEPVDHVGYTYLVFHVEPVALQASTEKQESAEPDTGLVEGESEERPEQ